MPTTDSNEELREKLICLFVDFHDGQMSLLDNEMFVRALSTFNSTEILKAAGNETSSAYADKALQMVESAVREARIDGMRQARNRVLRRTEIPSDAKKPTRDIVVIIGEECARIIQQDIEDLKSDLTQQKKG